MCRDWSLCSFFAEMRIAARGHDMLTTGLMADFSTCNVGTYMCDVLDLQLLLCSEWRLACAIRGAVGAVISYREPVTPVRCPGWVTNWTHDEYDERHCACACTLPHSYTPAAACTLKHARYSSETASVVRPGSQKSIAWHIHICLHTLHGSRCAGTWRTWHKCITVNEPRARAYSKANQVSIPVA